MQQEPDERPRVLDAEIHPVACTLFVLIVFVIVPFTVLSPFRYPQPSALDKMLGLRADTTVHPPLNPVADAFAHLPLDR